MKKQNFTLGVFLLSGLMLLLFSCKMGGKQQTGDQRAEQEQSPESREAQSMIYHNKLMTSFSPDWEEREPASDVYPAYYGGSFIDNAGRYVVCVVGDPEKYLPQIAAIIGSDDFLVESCVYSYREMMDVMDRIDRFLRDQSVANDHPVILNFAGSIADVLENRVVVNLLEASDEVIHAFQSDVSDSPVVSFKEGGMPVVG